MAIAVRLEDIVNAMEIPDHWQAYLDPETGEVVTVTDEDEMLLEKEDLGTDDLPEWQRESLESIRAILDSGRALALPDAFDIHEWDLMRRFAYLVEDPDQSAELLNAIHGRGAFRLFKMTTDRMGLREEWYRFRDEAVRQIARDWLMAHDIPFEEGKSREPGPRAP